MVCAFQGWNDAGDAASGAVSFLATALGAKRFARIDSEEFYDFQANRPCIRFGEDEQREIVWPTVRFSEAHAPRAPRDLVLVQGVEPSMRGARSAPTSWTWPRRWACRWWPRSARCWATCPTPTPLP